MRSKKGMEMAFSTIVVIVLSIILLIFLVMAITGSFKTLTDKVGAYFSTSNVDSIVEGCNNLVLQNFEYEYCCVNKAIRTTGNKRVNMPCSNASEQTWGDAINKLDCSGVC